MYFVKGFRFYYAIRESNYNIILLNSKKILNFVCIVYKIAKKIETLIFKITFKKHKLSVFELHLRIKESILHLW
jgi:hypothetical protein